MRKTLWKRDYKEDIDQRLYFPVRERYWYSVTREDSIFSYFQVRLSARERYHVKFFSISVKPHQSALRTKGAPPPPPLFSSQFVLKV